MTSPRIIDRALLPLRLARARARARFLDERSVSAFTVEPFDLGFPEGEAAYNGMGVSSDGSVWFSVGTRDAACGARIFVLDPRTSAIDCASDLTHTLGSGSRAIPQGKVHADLVEIDGRMYGASHLGLYDRSGSVERTTTVPGYAPYPGGWFFSVERTSGGFVTTPLAQAPGGEGIIAMSADKDRGLLWALTWPHANLVRFDLATREIHNYGAVSGPAESGNPRDGTWSRVCRSLAVDPATGNVFWTSGDGRILRFCNGAIDAVASLPRRELWRKAVRDDSPNVFWATGWDSSVLYRFDPATSSVEEFATLDESDAPPAATLAFALSPDSRKLHCLATGPGLLRERNVQLASTVWLVEVDLETRQVRRRGPLRTADCRWLVQSQALVISGDAAYSVCSIEVPERDRSPRAERLRALRRDEPEMRARGYAWEMMLVRVPL